MVKATFRGKSQVLMQAEAPDGGPFMLSVGLIDGEPGIRVDHQPHYNNSFSQYWVYEKTESRFRRLRIEHSQGCQILARPNPAVDPVRFALWTLRDKAARAGY